jgi:hypothetical protein
MSSHSLAASPTVLDKIVDRAGSAEVHDRLLAILGRLSSDTYLEQTKGQIQEALRSGEQYWDICGAELVRPTRYLEIGVRRGRSACVVAAIQPDVDLYLFDMWAPNYAGVPNPGPDFVRGELAAVGHQGRAVFVTGRSQATLPDYLGAHPALEFELMTVDGDHRDAEAMADLNNAAPRLAAGGVLVFDDIVHPQYPTLGALWRNWAPGQPGLITRANVRDGTGTALAFRGGALS